MSRAGNVNFMSAVIRKLSLVFFFGNRLSLRHLYPVSFLTRKTSVGDFSSPGK